MVAASGCATVSSIDVPWKTQTDRNSAANASDTSDTDTGGSAVDDATYWAKKAISASSQIAYAQHLRSVSEHNPELFAARHGNSTDASNANGHKTAEPPPGTGDGESPSSTAQAQTRTVARESNDTGSSATRPAAQPSANGGNTGESTTDQSPKVRTVRRDDDASSGARPSVWPVALGKTYGSTGRDQTPADPSADPKTYDLSKAEARKTISEKFGLEVPDTDGAVAISGTFLKPDNFEEFQDNEFNGFDAISEEQRHNQVAVVVPGKSITVYAGDVEIASRTFDSKAALPSELTAVQPLRIIDDGTLQLLVYWTESNKDADSDEKTVRYKAGLVKVIGPF
ncbi:MAG: hypothetical protein ABEK29_04965, partial [Bradymonadaceae bacterium]